MPSTTEDITAALRDLLGPRLLYRNGGWQLIGTGLTWTVLQDGSVELAMAIPFDSLNLSPETLDNIHAASQIVRMMAYEPDRVEREWAILGRQAGEIIGLIQGNKELGQMMGIAPGQGILEGLHRWLKEQAE